MGSPIKIRSKYTGPSHPWQRARIDSEKEIQKKFGLKNKKEIWKAASEVRRFTSQAKKLIAKRNEKQSKVEERQLLDKLAKLGLLASQSALEDVLALKASDLLERRLQTLVFKKGFALSPNQARQFIIHGHVNIAGKKLTIPAYIVPTNEEFMIEFNPLSALASPDHSERTKEKKEKKIEKKEDEAAKELEEIQKIEEKVGIVEE
jgi:small subunit ribosomal protein S4